jgi:hypothetical protein
LEKRVLTAIEFKRGYVMSLTKTAVKSRCGFYPFCFQIKIHKAMINEEIASYEVEELPGGKMIPDICKANSRGYPTSPSQGTKERGLGNTETPAPFQHVAGTIMLREIKRRVRVIENVVTDSQVKLHCLLYGFRTSTDCLHCVISNTLMIAIDD